MQYKLERKTVKRSRYISQLGSVESRNGKVENEVNKYMDLKSITILPSCEGIVKKQGHGEM